MLLKEDAKFYFFDEATSALDSFNEDLVLKAIKEKTFGKTVVHCAHRLSSITHVDKIFVLSDGKVAETGTHKELLKSPNSKYSNLWNTFLSSK